MQASPLEGFIINGVEGAEGSVLPAFNRARNCEGMEMRPFPSSLP